MRYRMSSSKALLFGGAPLLAVVSVGIGTIQQWKQQAEETSGTITDKAHEVADWTPLRALAGGLGAIGSFLAANPKFALALFGSVMFVVLVSYLASKVEHNVAKDPQRIYSKAQRVQAMNRAGGQCEMEGWLWFRCRKPGEHLDHFFPWSKGGATDMNNCVLACKGDNLRKGAKVPTLGQKIRLERRRRKYFPADQQVEAGNRVPSAPPREYPAA